MRTDKRNIEWIVFALLTAIVAVVLPALNAWAPPDRWYHVSDFSLNLYGKYLTYAILAISVDLLWGYTGLLSLGQALFFALGGYAMGMYLLLMIGERGQYKSVLPDYMVFLGYTELPLHFRPFYNFWFALGAVFWVPAVVAAIFGFMAFRARIKGVQFSILTQALTYAAALMFFRNEFTFGGNNGFTDFKEILGYDINAPSTRRALYIATAITLAIVYASCRLLTQSRFGMIQQAIRDGENRLLFSGYPTDRFKLAIFVLAAVIAAVGGALYVPQVGIINPSEMTPDKSLEAVVWVAVGGRGTLYGPVAGAIAVNALKSYSTRSYPEYWLFILGGLFIVATLFIPRGLVGLPAQISSGWVRLKSRIGTVPHGIVALFRGRP
ncbi:MAG: urea ABC transporter permease subunit UrtC [Kiritimatiellae bacterium]|nr:urea ABC transporter permease subunit UrtC [Kiritimatiellia bacterium]MDW8459366.1 urea ABC transporter permease subunit UrtC [Verrucomicrobiota bacterium]